MSLDGKWRLKDDVSRFFHQNLVMSRIKIRAYIKTEWPCREKFALGGKGEIEQQQGRIIF